MLCVTFANVKVESYVRQPEKSVVQLSAPIDGLVPTRVGEKLPVLFALARDPASQRGFLGGNFAVSFRVTILQEIGKLLLPFAGVAGTEFPKGSLA